MVSFKLNKRTFFAILLLALAFKYSDGIFTRSVLESTEEGEGILDLLPADGQGIQGGFNLTRVTPWFVSFADTALCRGVLVHKDIVLTAAHCVTGAKYPTRVFIGPTLNRTVSRGRIHPNWNGIIEQGFDVAVLKLSAPINEADAIANMNNKGNVPRDGQSMSTLGFDINTNPPNQLRGLVYNYVDQCEKRFVRYNPTFFLCADATPTKGTCNRDAGSPIVLNGTSTVVGLNSFSTGVCGSATVDIYTRVSTYRDWVVDQICEISSFIPDTCPASCLITNLLYRSVEVMRNFHFPGF